MGKYLDSTGLAHLIGKIKTALSGKQATLVSGTNIKTVNNQSLLGSGNITISGGGSSLPSGGAPGAILAKASATDGDVQWSGTAQPNMFYASSPNTNQAIHLWRKLVAADIPDLSGTYLPLSGGTLTGELVIEDSEIDRSTTPSANQYHRLIELVDANGDAVGYIQANHTTDGSVSFTLGSDNSDGTGQNQLMLGYSAGDGAFVVISHPAQWRTGLGLGTAATHAHGDYAPSGDYWTGDKGGTSYWGLVNPDGASTGWVRTPASGLLPAASGGGSSSLGTSYWPFSDIYTEAAHVTGDAVVGGTLTSNEINFSTSGVEGHFSNVTKSSRIAITSSNNLRVDSSSDSGETWGTYGYAALGTQAPSATAYRAANQVFATPNGSDGLPSMRKLVAADVTGLGDTAHGAGQSNLTTPKAATSVAASTTVNLDTIVLAPGTWLVTYAVEFASNATGYRRMTLTTNATSVTSTPVYMESGPAANGFATNLSKTQVIVNSGTSNITRYLNVYHTGSAALNCRSCIQAVRIA